MLMNRYNYSKQAANSKQKINYFLSCITCLVLFSNLAYADIDLEAMVGPIQQKTWVFVRIIEGLIAGMAGWRMLLSMSPTPIVLGVVGISLLELVKQFLK